MLNFARRIYRRFRPDPTNIAPFALTKEEARKIAGDGEVVRLFFEHEGRLIHKWAHYLELYDRHFRSFRGKPVRILEIGVSEGGSLDLWRKYFGPDAVIYGIDIEPVCASRVDPPNQVRIGSQSDSKFLRSVIQEMGGIDIVLDDGSHRGSDVNASFRTLFPLLSEGGVYAIEDLHADYWFRGESSTAMLKSLIDDLHIDYSGKPPAETVDVKSMALYDSIVFLEKRSHVRPGHVRVC